MNKEDLIKMLIDEGYTHISEIPNRGLCGLRRFVFTTGLVYGLNTIGYEGRYCYSHAIDAVEAIMNWNGEEDPQDEHWIKHKGVSGEWTNKFIIDERP